MNTEQTSKIFLRISSLVYPFKWNLISDIFKQEISICVCPAFKDTLFFLSWDAAKNFLK